MEPLCRLKPADSLTPGRSCSDTEAPVWTPTGRPRNKRPIMSSRSACSVPDLLPLTWPVVKLLVLSPPPPSASSHLLHNYSLSDGVIITAAIKSGFRSTPVFLPWLLLLLLWWEACEQSGSKCQTGDVKLEVTDVSRPSSAELSPRKVWLKAGALWVSVSSGGRSTQCFIVIRYYIILILVI